MTAAINAPTGSHANFASQAKRRASRATRSTGARTTRHGALASLTGGVAAEEDASAVSEPAAGDSATPVDGAADEDSTDVGAAPEASALADRSAASEASVDGVTEEGAPRCARHPGS